MEKDHNSRASIYNVFNVKVFNFRYEDVATSALFEQFNILAH